MIPRGYVGKLTEEMVRDSKPVDMLLHIARTALLRGEYSLSLDACAAVAPYLTPPLAAKPALGGQRNGEADRHDYATN